jgi:hypothetical protein
LGVLGSHLSADTALTPALCASFYYIYSLAAVLSPPGRIRGSTLSEMARVFQLLVYAILALPSNAASYGPSSYAPPGTFPTSLYSSYYNDPTATSAQPQPVISDPVLVRTCATFCEGLNALIHIYSTRYILLGSPTRRAYPRCVIVSRSASLDVLHYPHLFRPG